MNTATATLSQFRQSPRKMRLVVDLVRGKKVADALINLEFTNKKASLPIKNLIASALANAKSLGMDTEGLIVKTITVNPGQTLKRIIPAARGSAHPIRKRTSHIFVELGQPVSKQPSKIVVEKKTVAPKVLSQPKQKTEKTETKKVVAKKVPAKLEPKTKK